MCVSQSSICCSFVVCLCQIFFFRNLSFLLPWFFFSTVFSFNPSFFPRFLPLYSRLHPCLIHEGTIICLVDLVLGFPATRFPAYCSFNVIHFRSKHTEKTGLVENSKSSSLSRRESVVEEEKLVRIVEAKTHLQKLSEI